MTAHAITSDGEIIEKWAIHSEGFVGTVRQLICCARCGEELKGGYNTPRKVGFVIGNHNHFLCDPCWVALP